MPTRFSPSFQRAAAWLTLQPRAAVMCQRSPTTQADLGLQFTVHVPHAHPDTWGHPGGKMTGVTKRVRPFTSCTAVWVPALCPKPRGQGRWSQLFFLQASEGRFYHPDWGPPCLLPLPVAAPSLAETPVTLQQDPPQAHMACSWPDDICRGPSSTQGHITGMG